MCSSDLCLTINKLPQHVRLVTNEQRQNRPTARVIPADENADPEVAEIFDGIVRHIEYMSDADVAYDTACDNQVTYGEGYIRILTEYTKEDSFDQDIRIGRVRSSFSVYMDPMIQDPCGQDAEYCFITEDIPKAEYERMYPDATPVTGMMSQGVGDQTLAMWVSQETVRIAEYFEQARPLMLANWQETGFDFEFNVDRDYYERVEEAGVLIALNRQERGQGELSAIQEVERDYGMPVVSIVSQIGRAHV